jgi:fimbrial chaperone protein
MTQSASSKERKPPRRAAFAYWKVDMRAHCLLLILGLSLPATAGHAFTLTPMSTTFASQGSGAAKTFRVDNDTSNRVAFEISVLTRDMNEDGMETNRPAADLFTVFPPQGAIAPGKSQTVRVVWKGAPNPSSELAFRVVAEELPVNFKPDTDKAQIKVILRYMAAVYVCPRNARPNLQVAGFTRTGTNTYVLTVTNAGTAHRPLINPKLTLTGAQSQDRDAPADSLGPISGETVLAGRARRFVLTLPADFTEPSYRARLTTDE